MPLNQQSFHTYLKKKNNKNKNFHISSFAVDRKKSKKKFYYHNFYNSNVLALSGFYKINKSSKDHIRINTSERDQLIKNINHSFIVDCVSLDEFIKKN